MTALDVDAFRIEARTFLEAHASRRGADRPVAWGDDDDRVTISEEVDAERERAELAAAVVWAARRFDAGFGWIDGPVEYGGRGLTPDHRRAYLELEAAYDVPAPRFSIVGLGMVAPTLLAHGSDDLRHRYLAALYRGDLLACLLSSEPGAGSDLAAVQTRAERDGDEWVINGQKVWTSVAHLADIGEIICRTDPSLPKHRGLTAFLIDMRAPGVEVRPLRQMTGGAAFNEVFLTDVRVPDTHRIGAVNDGWSVTLTTLMSERASIGVGLGSAADRLDRLIELYRRFGAPADEVLRDKLVRVIVTDRVNAFTAARAMARVAAGGVPGPELSITKLAMTKQTVEISELAAAVLGPRVCADTGEWGTFTWSQLVLSAPAGRLAGGTDEVLRNIIGERVLGLPKEPGVDPSTPFMDLPGTTG